MAKISVKGHGIVAAWERVRPAGRVTVGDYTFNVDAARERIVITAPIVNRDWRPDLSRARVLRGWAHEPPRYPYGFTYKRAYPGWEAHIRRTRSTAELAAKLRELGFEEVTL